MKERLKQSISVLKIDSNIVDKLVNNNINTIEDIWVLTKRDLKQMGFKDIEIHQISIHLELYGIDLGKRIWKA